MIGPIKQQFGLRALFGIVRPYSWSFSLALIALALGSAINLILPEVVRRFIDAKAAHSLWNTPLEVAVALLVLFAAQAGCFYLRSRLFGRVGHRVVADVRRRLYTALLNQPISFFDARRIGDLTSRLIADTAQLQDLVSIRLSVLIRYGFQVLVGTVLMLSISLRLAMVILLILPVILGLGFLLSRRLKKISKQLQTEVGQANAIAEETLGGIRTVQAFNRAPAESRRFEETNVRALNLGLSRADTSAFFSSFVSFLLNGAILLVMLYGLHLVHIQTLSVGDLTAFLLYGVIVAVSFAFFTSGYAELLQSWGSGERILEFLEPPNSSDLSQLKAAPQLKMKGEIAFEQVSFAYPSRPEQQVLTDVSFQIAPGKTTAIVGPSGAGKSTLIALILKFYPISSGHLYLDGTEINQWNTESLRSGFALVPQEPQLFAVSIAENLRYGRADASPEELRRACEQAAILEFVDTLPQKFETQIGERGVRLSAGQRQRLAIARAILRDPSVLILDEATSSLDSENEHLIQQALKKVLPGRTAIVIAHRLSTIKQADCVIVLDRGKVVQIGTHASLYEVPGLYRLLVERQELFS